jgi:glyoxylase-like metal-dependent hydrolase (beta-lactamase superfamily II)
VFAGSIGRTDLPGGDTETLLDAIVRKILTLPPETILFSGHGPETTVAAESATNPFLASLLEPCVHCGHPHPHGDCSDA